MLEQSSIEELSFLAWLGGTGQYEKGNGAAHRAVGVAFKGQLATHKTG
jgi:hypothetical protein